ncbi:MAG: hypothetical protein IT349_12980 [Candidatus Eisenbacteria bacterium]|nr:hypothetical protein [Candidatus Eisenbacteria bacterium]
MSETPRFEDDPRSTQLIRVYEQAQPVEPHEPLGFSCRGCGQICCTNVRLFMTPPEAMRILWHLERHTRLAQSLQARGIRWGDLSIGHSSGLPTLQMCLEPIDRSTDRGDARCPFLVPVHRTVAGRSEPTGMHWCGLHAARPVACRTFPLGVRAENGAITGHAITARCPGFEPAAEGEVVPPDYIPPSPDQTVEAWIGAQLDPEQMAETRFYVTEVMGGYLDQGLHVSTEDNPEGELDDDQVVRLGAEFFYRPIPAPVDPDEDHATLMGWMRELIEALPLIRRQLLATHGE